MEWRVDSSVRGILSRSFSMMASGGPNNDVRHKLVSRARPRILDRSSSPATPSSLKRIASKPFADGGIAARRHRNLPAVVQDDPAHAILRFGVERSGSGPPRDYLQATAGVVQHRDEVGGTSGHG